LYKEYIRGFYARDDLHLQVINKESNRKMLEALKDAYPDGLNAYEIAKATHLPLKTIYTSLYGEIAKQINHSIHLKYVTSEGLNDPEVASYLSR
jgi:hypothetical protein